MVRYRVFWVLATSLIALTNQIATRAADRPPRKYALVVGVREYRAGQPLPALPYAEPDAEELAKVLERGGYAVTLMTQSVGGQNGQFDKLPLASNLRDQLGAILGNPFLKEQDTVLLALAGHGVLLRVVVDGHIAERFFFCPMNADVASLIEAAKRGEFLPIKDVHIKHHLVSLDELYEQLGNSCQAGVKLLLVDACRNDPSRDVGTRAVESLTLPPLPPPRGGVAAFFSCTAHEKAQEDPDLKNGVFFHFVIEGLSGKADFSEDNIVSLSELNEYVGTNVYDFVFRKYKSKQTPELRGTIRGRADLIRAVPKTKLARVQIPRPETKSTNVFAEDFSTTTPGTTPKAWKVVGEGLAVQEIARERNALQLRGAGQGLATIPLPQSVSGDFRLTCNFHLHGYVDWDRRLSLRLEASNRHAVMELGIVDRYPNVQVAFGSQAIPYPPKQLGRPDPYVLELERSGSTFSIRLNGTPIHSARGSTQAVAGISLQLLDARPGVGNTFPTVYSFRLEPTGKPDDAQ